jgi:hypothetical protein
MKGKTLELLLILRIRGWNLLPGGSKNVLGSGAYLHRKGGTELKPLASFPLSELSNWLPCSGPESNYYQMLVRTNVVDQLFNIK